MRTFAQIQRRVELLVLQCDLRNLESRFERISPTALRRRRAIANIARVAVSSLSKLNLLALIYI